MEELRHEIELVFCHAAKVGEIAREEGGKTALYEVSLELKLTLQLEARQRQSDQRFAQSLESKCWRTRQRRFRVQIDGPTVQRLSCGLEQIAADRQVERKIGKALDDAFAQIHLAL